MDTTIEELGVAHRERRLNASCVATGVDGREVLVVQGGVALQPVQLAVMDPVTGRALSRHAISELSDSLSMITGADGMVYVPGWGPRATLFRLDPVTDELTELGVAVTGETHICRLISAADGVLYGGTYPNAHVFSYDPVAERFTDLGRIAEGEHYARSIAFDGDDILYVGTEGRARILRLRLGTGVVDDVVLPETMQPTDYRVSLLAWRRERLFAYFGSSQDWHVYDPASESWIARIPDNAPSMPSPVSAAGMVYLPNIATGRVVAYDTATDTYAPTDWQQQIDYRLGGAGLHLMSLDLPDHPGQTLVGAGRGGELWRWNPDTNQGSVLDTAQTPETPVTIRAIHTGSDGRIDIGLTYNTGVMVRFDPVAERFVTPGRGTTNQTHSYLNFGDRIYAGTYSDAVLYEYDPAGGHAYRENPRVLLRLGDHHQDRIFGLADAGDRVAFGTLGKRGHASGRFGFLDPVTGQVQDKGEILPGHSINALCRIDEVLYGATSVDTPGGDPMAPEALIFAWDLTDDRMLWTRPLTGVMTVGDLIAGPTGRLWALTTAGTLVDFDPGSRDVVRECQVTDPGGSHGFPTIRFGPDGLLYGASGVGAVFVVDPASVESRTITTGSHLTFDDDGRLYFSRGAELFRLANPVAGNDRRRTGHPAHVTTRG